MSSAVVESINRKNVKTEGVPAFSIGDSVRVHARVREGEKERVQVFAGTVIARKGTGGTETFTVRRISHGVGVERVFPVHSPSLSAIEVTGAAHARRAKLYFLRRRTGKAARLREKNRS